LLLRRTTPAQLPHAGEWSWLDESASNLAPSPSNDKMTDSPENESSCCAGAYLRIKLLAHSIKKALK
jgi:hypothetical protein